MALVFLEGFGAYSAGSKISGSDDELKLLWSSWNETPNIVEITNGTQGRKAYLTGNGTGDNDLEMVPKTKTFDTTTIYVGFRFYWADRLASMIWQFRDGTSNLGFLLIDAYGRIAYCPDNQAQQTSTTIYSTKNLTYQAWNYVEAKITFNATTGTVDFWLNGTAAGSYTNQDTIAFGTSCDNVIFANAQAYADWGTNNDRITDMYIDTTTQHGPMDIWYQPCDTAGAASGFTPLASTNQSQVDEIGADGDTSYNESTAAVTLDQLAHSDSLNVAPLALQPLVMARYVPTGSSNIQVGVLSGATHDQDAEVGISDTYDGYPGKIYETDPNTASAWTAANADAADTSYEHSS